MNVSLVRVDNRLIHGQILEAWVPYVQATCIVVADDDVANDFFRETVIRMAVPREIEVVITGVADFVKSHSYEDKSGEKTIILFSTLRAAVKAFNLGFHYDSLNIGNVYEEEGAVQWARSIRLGERDISDLVTLNNAGVQIELRCVPQDKPVSFQESLKKAKRKLPGLTLIKGRDVAP
ncbi:MAG: PTS sugar transporter subunit IIB [Syntrophobacterales bacterium]|nr:PTS sugar transporter subunit IIB [Syntrophobacterales bacterium]